MLKLKSWMLFLLFSNYLIVEIFVPENLFLEVLTAINICLLFVWYYLILRKLHKTLELKFQFPVAYYLISGYMVFYMLLKAVEYPSSLLETPIWDYFAIAGYLIVNIYVSLHFARAEEKAGIEPPHFVVNFLQFFLYPVGIFFINPRFKKILSTKI